MLYSIAFGLRRTSKSACEPSGCRGLFAPVSWICLAVGMAIGPACHGQNQVVLEVVDTESREPIPARIEFTRSGKKLKRDRKTLIFGDTWLAEGSLTMQPPPGEYEFLVHRGPEFNTIRGGFTIERGSRDTVLIELPRSIDIHAEGWYSGDLSSDVAPELLSRWQAADALDMVVHASDPSSAKRAQPSKDAPKRGGPDEVGYGWMGSSVEYRSPTIGLALHRLSIPAPNDPYEALEAIETDPSAIAEITQMLSPDLPILLAHPKVRTVRVLNGTNRSQRDALLELDRNPDDGLFAKLNMDLGKGRWNISILAPFPEKDQIRFRGPRGAGRMSEAVHWLALDAGLRLSPTAASGFGSSETHLGYNRVYAYCDTVPTSEEWWHAIDKGETFITNGPLLRVKINEVPPGTVQGNYRGEPIPLDIAVSLAVRDPVDYLDVIFNGVSLYNAKLEDHYRKGEFPPLEIDQSGWLVVRVVTAHEQGYRLATTAPFYFDFGGRNRIDRKAVEFFLEWLARIETSIADQGIDTAPRRRAMERAKTFWQEKRNASN